MHALAQSLVQGLVYGGIYSIAALGFALVYFTTGVFHIAYGAIFTVGAYLAVSLGADTAGGLVVGLAAGMAAAATLSAATYCCVYLPMLRRGAATLELFVVSLGLNLALIAAILIAFGPNTRNFDFPDLFRQHELLGVTVSWLGVACIALGVVALAGITLLGRRTLLGQQMRAIGANPELAQLRGVRVVAVTAGVYALAGALSVVAAVLFGMNTSVTSSGGTSPTLLASIATLLGGRGSYAGAYLGGLIVAMIGAISSALLPGQWEIAVVFAAFILIVLARPQGLLKAAVA